MPDSFQRYRFIYYSKVFMDQILPASSNINLKFNLIKRLFNFKQPFNFALFLEKMDKREIIISTAMRLFGQKGF